MQYKYCLKNENHLDRRQRLPGTTSLQKHFEKKKCINLLSQPSGQKLKEKGQIVKRCIVYNQAEEVTNLYLQSEEDKDGSIGRLIYCQRDSNMQKE